MLSPVLTAGAWPCVPSPWMPCLGTAGEDAVRIQPTLMKMKASGVRAILDYAAVECSGACCMPASAPQRSAEQCNAHDPSRLPLRSGPPRRAGSLRPAGCGMRAGQAAGQPWHSSCCARCSCCPCCVQRMMWRRTTDRRAGRGHRPQVRCGVGTGASHASSVCCTPVVCHGCHHFLAPAD